MGREIGWQALVLVSMLLCAIAAQAEMTNSQHCNDERNFLERGWNQLSATESMLVDAYKKTSAASGTTNVFNCRVTWPVDGKGNPIEGMRTVVLDQQWGQKGQFQHHAYRIHYYLYAEPLSGGGYSVTRRVFTFETCRSPNACKHLGIPAPEDAFEMLGTEDGASRNGRNSEKRTTPPPTGGVPGSWSGSLSGKEIYKTIPSS